jgi:hypothetical protein
MKDTLAVLGLGLSTGWLAASEGVGKVAYPGPAKLAPEWVAWVHKSQVVAGAVFAVCVLVLLYAAHASEQAQTT